MYVRTYTLYVSQINISQMTVEHETGQNPNIPKHELHNKKNRHDTRTTQCITTQFTLPKQ